MPRNRQIKADFWSDEKIGRLSIPARLMFIGLWNFADDSGVCRGNPMYIKNQIFPYDNMTVKTAQGLLNECSLHGLIKLMECSNEQYLEILNFTKHQLINRPSKFRYITDLENTHYILTEGSLTNVNVNVNVNVNENVNEQAFVSFWNLYPARNGKKFEKGVCLKMFMDLKKEDIPDMLKAVKNYADSEQIKNGIGIKDPKRFIRNDFWKEWIESETVSETPGKELTDYEKDVEAGK
jgi:hypothetical protein